MKYVKTNDILRCDFFAFSNLKSAEQQQTEPKQVVEVASKKSETTQKPRKEPQRQSGPRKAGKISVNFTPRVFPTPQRESKEAEENEVRDICLKRPTLRCRY